VDRKRLIGLAALLVGCPETPTPIPSFDGPVSAAVLPADGTIFDEPIGFVANSRSGIIVPLDLKHGTLLSDQFAAPFMRPRWIATGSSRVLGDIMAWSPTEDTISLLAADAAHGVLIEAPYIVGFDGEPEVVTPTYGEPEFIDVDGSGDAAVLSNVELRRGWSTTEGWVVEFDGDVWTTTGSRSGRQEMTLSGDGHFVAGNREVEFDLKGSATRGDRFEFTTETGLIEHDLGGTVTVLARVPGQRLAAVGIWDTEAEQGSIVLWDLDLGAERGRFELAEGAQPWSLAFGISAAELFIGDAHAARIFETVLVIDNPALSTWTEIQTDGAVVALAYVQDSPDADLLDAQEALAAAQADTGGADDIYDTPGVERDYRHLFVAPAGLNRVDVYDVEAQTWLDVNPQDDSDKGISVHAPVVGLDATPDRVMLHQENNAGVRTLAKSVAVTTYTGSLFMFEGGSGCAALTVEGPHVPMDQGAESIAFADAGRVSDPYLLEDSATLRRVQTHLCGGVVREEQWTMSYSEVDGRWEVEGSKSGIQVGRAAEDKRYVSDDGAVSFTILAGSLPTSDGDSFVFYTDEGILRIDGALRSGASEALPLELPGKPLIFQYDAGPTGGGWDPLDRRTFVLLPVTNSDIVLRVRIEHWLAEVIWD
jgi:hypothetical protein